MPINLLELQTGSAIEILMKGPPILPSCDAKSAKIVAKVLAKPTKRTRNVIYVTPHAVVHTHQLSCVQIVFSVLIIHVHVLFKFELHV